MTTRVLLADDLPQVRMIALKSLQDHGYQVEVVDCGKAVLDRVGRVSLDAIVLDLYLRDMTGLTVLDTITLLPPHMRPPVLMLTVESSESIADECRRRGASGYLVKPYGLRSLAQRVEAMIEASAR